MTAKAHEPEDLTRLFVDLANAQDVDGLTALYEEDAVLAFPPGSRTTGRAAIRELMAAMVAGAPHFEPEPPQPTVRAGDLALTSTRSRDGKGSRVQLVRRQPDGTWLRVIDRPENVE
jgi:ketosteroid isomerase-like protein